MRILVVAPHADDETLGMGGTIARYAREGHDVTVAVLTGHGDDAPHPLWGKEVWDTVRAELREACAILGVREIIFEEIPAVMVSEQPVWKLNRVTGRIVQSVEPDIMYVPFLNDLHRDHRACFHSFSVAWRPFTTTGNKIKEVFSYEVASETHLNFAYVEQGFFPNTWVDISDYLDTKLQALACYKSQIKPHPSSRSLKAIEAQAVWRGAQVGVAAAEAFVLVRKIS